MIRYVAMVFETLDIKGSGPKEMAKKKGKWFLRLPQVTSLRELSSCGIWRKEKYKFNQQTLK